MRKQRRRIKRKVKRKGKKSKVYVVNAEFIWKTTILLIVIEVLWVSVEVVWFFMSMFHYRGM